MNATASNLANLKKRLEQVTSDHADVALKRMFGCDAFFRGSAIFALVWKEGRIGVKMSEPSDYEGLMRLAGASPWKAGERVMSQWVLLPPAYNDNDRELARWVTRAWELAGNAPITAKKTAKPKTPKKTAGASASAPSNAAKKTGKGSRVARKTS